MQLHLNKLSFIILSFLVITKIFAGTTVFNDRFYLYFENEDEKYLNNIKESILISENFFVEKFGKIPEENLDIKISSSVSQMTTDLKTGYWIGGFYSNYKVFLQPIAVLKKKDVFQKIIFIEYAHYYIDSYTDNNCRLWLNEMLSSYYYSIFSKQKIDFNYKIQYLLNYKNLTDLQTILKTRKTTEEFNIISVIFVSYLTSKYGSKFIDELLNELKEENINSIFIKKTKKIPEEIYRDFLNNRI
jgi:hypothetical protein